MFSRSAFHIIGPKILNIVPPSVLDDALTKLVRPMIWNQKVERKKKTGFILLIDIFMVAHILAYYHTCVFLCIL